MGLDVPQRIGECHVPELVVMAVCLTVSCDIHQLGPVSLAGKAAQDALCKGFAALQEVFECNPLRDRAIVKKDADPAARWQPAEIRPCGIDPSAADVLPASGADPSDLGCLAGRKHSKDNPMLRKDLERFNIDSSLGQPHAFRHVAEALLKILNAPDDLSMAVAAVCQRHDDMVVYLGHGAAMS